MEATVEGEVEDAGRDGHRGLVHRVGGRRLLPARLLLKPPVILQVEGGLDGCGACAIRLARHVNAAVTGRRDALVVLDTAAVDSIDAAGLEAVRVVAAGLAEAGHGLWLWAPSPAVRRALEVAGVDEDLQPLPGGQGAGSPGGSSVVVDGVGGDGRLGHLERLEARPPGRPWCRRRHCRR